MFHAPCKGSQRTLCDRVQNTITVYSMPFLVIRSSVTYQNNNMLTPYFGHTYVVYNNLTHLKQ